MIARIRSLVQGHSGRVTVGVAAGLALAVVAVVVALLAVVAGPSGTTSATDVTPTLISGNPDCDDSGVGELVKVEPVADGTFSVAGGSITIVVDNGAKTFDWTSTVSIGLIIVKGGPNANEYVYVPASFGDTGLHAPTNPKNGRFYGLSHISFCDPGEANPTPTPKLITGNLAFSVNLETGVVIPCIGNGDITVQTTKVVENEGSSSYTYEVAGEIVGSCTGAGAFSLSFEQGSEGACKGTEGADGPFQCLGENIVKIIGDTVGELTVTSSYKCADVLRDGDDLLICAGTGDIVIPGFGTIKGFTFIEKPTPTPEKCTDRKGCPTPEPKPTATPKGDPEPNR